jgi:hypothetical protein
LAASRHNRCLFGPLRAIFDTKPKILGDSISGCGYAIFIEIAIGCFCTGEATDIGCDLIQNQVSNISFVHALYHP